MTLGFIEFMIVMAIGMAIGFSITAGIIYLIDKIIKKLEERKK